MGKFKAVFERVEKKYVLSEEQYRALRERLQGIAKVDEYGKTGIYNIYYDTPDFHLIRQSLRKPKYKEKLRLRSYGIAGDDTPSFIEIKKKFKGVVYKRRIELPYEEALHALLAEEKEPEEKEDGNQITRRSENQIAGEIKYLLRHYEGIRPAMAVAYDRIAMVGEEDPELRITFDTNIRYSTTELDLRKGNHGKQILRPGEHLMEVKITGALPLVLAHIFSELNIHPVTFSKYGRGYVQMRREEMQRSIAGTVTQTQKTIAMPRRRLQRVAASA